MNSAQLIAYFDRITEAPQAISRLRGFILSLAVGGRLVEQDPNDEPATELLKRIEIEKARLAKTRKTGKEVLAEIEDDRLPFQVPRRWQWARLAFISNRIHYGFTASATSAIKSVRLL